MDPFKRAKELAGEELSLHEEIRKQILPCALFYVSLEHAERVAPFLYRAREGYVSTALLPASWEKKSVIIGGYIEFFNFSIYCPVNE